MEENSTPLISFSEADILGGDNVVIYGLDLEVFPGEIVYIVGKVGSGKTSIFRTVTAENRLHRGSGRVCGYDLRNLRRRDVPQLRRRLGVVFQDFQLLMDRSVEANLAFVLKATGWKDSAAIARRINEVLEAVGMTTKAHKMPHQLSGGEQQRIAIARAILNDPALILADEPTGNLDDETAEGILQLLGQINREKGTAIVMVTHNRSICTRYPGRIFETRDEACREITA
ncbi:MAG: ATP-binding cassette domain-containing protein [Bacteroidales bacterium]|jgi:cell division transport system ATP-binding protein|nr:ATP-binding cassette domain-containing protein [Bacteroidales bacterium]